MTKGSIMSEDDSASIEHRVSRTRARLVRKVRPISEPVATSQAKDPQEVKVGKRSTTDMKAIGGSGFELWDSQLLCRTAMTASPSLQAGEDAGDPQRRNAGVAGLALHAFAPQDPVEAMIAAQATALHFATMECARRAMVPGQSPDVASKLRKDAANSARAMVEMTEALQRRRGKGVQTIKVERVVVQDGGQAVVGTVTAGASLPPSGPMPQALAQGAPPMPAIDVQPIEAGAGVE